MKLDKIQIALFAAYDIRNALTPEELGREKDEEGSDTIGESLQMVIEFLEDLEIEVAEAA